MAFRYIVILALLLTACAQVKSLEGGPKDTLAPEPYAIVPASGTVNFTGRAIAIRLNEYVKLNNPNQTIKMVPNDAKIQTELQDKTLLVYWTESLRENTTYSIYFNKTIQDVTESNDSILQYVFSTGPVIDSLTYTCFVANALDNQPVKGALVGLFDHPDSLTPIYFAQTDNSGKASLNYLKAGSYYVRAFDDALKNGKISNTNSLAFLDAPIQLQSNTIDSVPLRLFKPLLKPDITSISYQQPGSFIIAANRNLKDAKIEINSTVIPQNSIEFFSIDSVIIYQKAQETNPQIVTVTASDWSDTVKTRVTIPKLKTFKLEATQSSYFDAEPVVFQAKGGVTSIDTSLVRITSTKDSSTITPSFELKKNEVHFTHLFASSDEVKVVFKEGALLAGDDWKSEVLEKTISKRLKKDCGVLNVTISGYSEPLIVEVFNKSKQLQQLTFEGDTTFKLEDLEPGEYHFKISVDTNNNGQLDTGDFEHKIQPEEVHIYSTPTKVRANWEVDVTLERQK